MFDIGSAQAKWRPANMLTEKAGVVVITGASAGVGRASAVAFARKGWNVALLARGTEALEAARIEVEQAGTEAIAVPLDVADAQAVFAAADQVLSRWGAIDVWVNCAMATIFAPLPDISAEEFRRVTEVTYLGQVYGTMAALKHMRAKNRGVIIQVGSALSYRAIPLQSAYCGAKFAVRGFTDSLRSELIHENSNIRLTMLQLPAVNTPQFDWARNRLPRKVRPVPPIFQPEAIAVEVVRAAHRAPRELWFGWPALKAIVGTMLLPKVGDYLLAREGYSGQMTSEPALADRPDNLFAPVMRDFGTRGRFDQEAKEQVFALQPTTLRIAFAVATIVILVGAIMLGRML